MNLEQHRKFLEELTDNYESFKSMCCSESQYEMFDNIKMIYTYDQIYDYLLCEHHDWNIKYLKTKDILNYYYEKFTETNYDITRSDLKEFFKDQMEIEKKKQNDNEM